MANVSEPPRSVDFDHGLSAATVAKIYSVLVKYAGVQQAILYGSRAKGTYRVGSDIDLTLLTNAELSTKDLLSRITEDLDDLNLPYTIDLSFYKEIEDPDLTAHIVRCGKTLYRRKSN